MNRYHGVVVGLSLSGLAIALFADPGQAQVKPEPATGPGSQGAALQVPAWMQGSSSAAAGVSQANAGAPFLATSSPAAFKPLPPYQEPPDPNKDILVTPAQGPWMICVHWYTNAGLKPGEPDCHQLARNMVMELRNNPTYRLQAYVYNRGAEERRKEYERVKALIEKQREFLVNNKLPPDTKLRYKVRHIEDECAILVGNYPDPDTARHDLERIRKLDHPDPKRVSLATMFQGKQDEKGKITVNEARYVNPFKSAFVVHNPLLAMKRPAEWEKEDMEALRKLNKYEEFSLLKCQKPYTLMVKQFLLPTVLQTAGRDQGNKSAGAKFMDSIGLAKKSDADNAAIWAHQMAERFHQIKMDGYVLHTRYASIVTVGAFEGPYDPVLKSTQEMLATRFKIPQAVPIPVPR